MDPYKEVRYVVPELDNVEVSCGHSSLSTSSTIAHGMTTVVLRGYRPVEEVHTL